ncbi:GNAT family N-acetyltransferase [uncultured Desulfovibrio sp.]|uniref:GNAT family N-acetyltransferase n=1 Tax=uncultured Desulfovibrio sp. TaxID=167968 RepID=UPI00265CE62C|nr:GNAT family N-acetyltransferase [uncultured Desulfovibrio sp.]
MTERCCLRPMTDADFPALCRYLQDAGVMYAYGHAFTDREVWDWLRRQQARYAVPGYGALAVELRETGEMIGQCGITMQDCAGVTACTAVTDGEANGSAPAGEATGAHALLSGSIDATPRTLQVPEVGYLLAKRYWHHGYATESARACMEFAFDVLGVPEIFSCIRDDNMPSLAVARRNGMELCGRFSKQYYGQDMEHLLYVARKESWSL